MSCESKAKPRKLQRIKVLAPMGTVVAGGGGLVDDSVLTVQDDETERTRIIEHGMAIRRRRAIVPILPELLEFVVDGYKLREMDVEIVTSAKDGNKSAGG